MTKTKIKYGETLHIRKKLQCEFMLWGREKIEKEYISPGYYDIIQVRKDKVLLALNLSKNGKIFQPSSKYQYWIAKKLLKNNQS